MKTTHRLSVVLFLAFFAFTSIASARNIVAYRGIICSYDKVHETYHGEKYDLKFQFRGSIEHDMETGKITGQHGSTYQHAEQDRSNPHAAEDSVLLVSSSSWGPVKTYKPRSEQYRAYLDGNGYKFEPDYVGANGGIGGFLNYPYSTYLYISQKPHSVVVDPQRDDIAEVKMKALFAVQFHDHMQPDYIRLDCVARRLTFR